MRAAKLASPPISTAIAASSNSMEALVANLCVSSAGLNQNALLRLFCKSLQQFFGASGAYCRLFSRREGWVTSYSEGKLPWGAFEGSLPSFQEEMINEIVRTRTTVVRRGPKNDGSSARHGIDTIWMAIPFLKTDELLGAALLTLPAGSENFDRELIGHATAIGVAMAGLLEHSRILGQVEVSRKQWVQVMDTIPDCIVVHDKDKKIIRANSALARRINTHPINLVGRDIREVIALNGGNPGDPCPLCLRESDGITKPIEIFSKRSFLVSTSIMMASASETDTQIIHVLIDIHDRLAAEAALHRERDFNERILNNTQNIILVLDMSGRITYVNRRAEELGSSHRELSGLPLAQIIHTSHRPLFDAALRTVREGNPAESLEAPVARPDGRVSRFALHLSSIKDEAANVGSIVVVMTDITEASVLQANLARTEKMAALGQLVSGVAHEINNPLAAIVGFADLLCENPAIPASAREELEAILREAERTRVLVQDLLSFAHDVPPQSEPVPINSLLRQTLKMRSYSLAGREVKVVERMPADLPVVVGDPHQLQQVFLNILNNAYDAVEGTGRSGQIDIETALAGEFVEIRIRDNGPGIANSERIFEPFFTTKPVGKGTGLGLSICYGIVRTHRGEILCHNNSGADGCTFVVRLPAAIIRTPESHEVTSGNGIANSPSGR